MDDYISRQAAIDLLFSSFDFIDNESFGYILGELKMLSSDDVRKNRRAVKVIHDSGMTHYYTCGLCGKPVDMEDDFCRYCGAELVGGEK